MSIRASLALLAVLGLAPSIARADGTYFPLASGNFAQDWSDAGLISSNDDWSRVSSIIGYRGDDVTGTAGVDPQTLTGEGTITVDVVANVMANNTTGGVLEVDTIGDGTIALQGSATADAPSIVLHLNATGRSSLVVSYVLRDLDVSADDAIMQFALQYRVGTTGPFINVPAGYVADATTISAATQRTTVMATLPGAVDGQAQVQVRIITVNATGADELVGVDDILVTSTGASAFDFGDAPSSYELGDPARHDRGSSGPILGTLVTTEAGPTPLDAADDGVTLPLSVGRGQTFDVPVFGTSPLTNYEVLAWFDWNHNGTFEATERYGVAGAFPVVFTDDVTVVVPPGAAAGTTWARFRVATAFAPATPVNGVWPDGEVEDYTIEVVARCGDAFWDPGEACDEGDAAPVCGCLPDCSGFAPSGTPCAPAGTGACDVADTCSGAGTCVPRVAANGTTCRAAVSGGCDLAEVCDGVSATCPGDAFAPSSTVCRASTDVCDVAESCTGTSSACPSNAFAPSSTVCRASSDTCDVAESCTGTSAACPSNAFAPSSTVCRASSDACDVAESCTGTSAACPSNAFAPSTTVCRASTDVCDVAESCTGAGAACPTNAFAPSSTVCRASAGTCDVSESCTGSSATCPTDAPAADGTACADGDVCDGSETCASGACVAGTPLDCDDGDPCTADACDVDGCENVVIPGCGDAGMPDAGLPDAGTPDGGVIDEDAGEIDEDAGEIDEDAGVIDEDAGVDSGTTDGGGATDTGPRDAGAGGLDGGAGADVGSMVVTTGCNCRAGGGGSGASGLVLAALGLMLALRARRRR